MQQQQVATIVLYVLLFVVFYVLLIRPQQVQRRKRQDMLNRLKKGDRVVTAGGLHAVIAEVKDDSLTLELAPNLRVKADRGAVSYVRTRKDEGARKEEGAS
ncbi:MAG: preprotein translocase subunit YajC [Armatimonadetes bacterium]|nr:preprotein translocase subunit YajC [Armatimonadota bacterium]